MPLNLFTRHALPIGLTNLPVVVLMHGYTDGMINFSQSALERIASYGMCVLVPDMRVAKDNSGREIHDIVDAVNHYRTVWNTRLSADKVAIVGYSGGGGNALAAACKFPDFWTTIVSHFGMSDYGYDAVFGWWAQNVGGRPTIEARMGGNPTEVPNAYRARNTLEALPNASGAYFHFFHDASDESVQINQSERAATALSNAGLTNYVEHYTTVSDNPRWTHGYPNAEPLSLTENYWKNDVLTREAWTISSSGSLRIIGYVKTKRFAIWLRTTGTTVYGLDAVADVTWGLVENHYSIAPLSGALDVSITQSDGKTGNAANIADVTDILVE